MKLSIILELVALGKNQMEYIKEYEYPIGKYGNKISLDTISDNNYRLMIVDHYTQNFIDFYMTKQELVGLAEFIHNYLEKDQ